VLARIAGFLYRESDKIVVVTLAFKDHLVEHWGVAPEKISIVQNGVEAETFRPDRSNIALRKDLDIESKFVVCYIGTMGMAHGLDTVLQAAAQLLDSAPQVLFLLVGDGAEKEHIISRARELRLTNLRVIDQQPREKIPEYICASDVCLVLLKRTPVFETVIPTKMLEFMSCARAIILGVDGQARKIMEEAGAGLFIQPENAEELVQAVTRLAENPSLRKTLGNNGRRHILQNFSRQKTAETYLQTLEELLK
jgi:glycosyltransferase involved in cell wall biosynthesis